MKNLCTVLFVVICSSSIQAQLTTLPDGGNKTAWVGERIGLTDLSIHYNRPAVKGREGKIWGSLVYPGFSDLGFGSSKAAPWRAGANENTTIEFSTDVKIEGHSLAAGKYGLFIAWDPVAPTLILSRNSSSWGSFFYAQSEDVLRVTLKPVPTATSKEWLTFEFLNETENTATISLAWEKMSIPFIVEVDYVNIQLESFRKELRSEKGFNPGWQSYNQAARFTADRNTDLNEGLKWADQAISEPFVGEANFQTLSTKADILTKLGRNAEADSVMKKALPMGTMIQLHQYGRRLLMQKKNAQALEVFKMNFAKNPRQFTTLIGLTRGFSANGDFKNALKNAKLALPLAPDEMNKSFVQAGIKKLEEGKDINQ